jgi:hypothetical protein
MRFCWRSLNGFGGEASRETLLGLFMIGRDGFGGDASWKTFLGLFMTGRDGLLRQFEDADEFDEFDAFGGEACLRAPQVPGAMMASSCVWEVGVAMVMVEAKDDA